MPLLPEQPRTPVPLQAFVAAYSPEPSEGQWVPLCSTQASFGHRGSRSAFSAWPCPLGSHSCPPVTPLLDCSSLRTVEIPHLWASTRNVPASPGRASPEGLGGTKYSGLPLPDLWDSGRGGAYPETLTFLAASKLGPWGISKYRLDAVTCLPRLPPVRRPSPPSIHLSCLLPVHLPTHPFSPPFIYLPTYLSICLSLPSIYLSTNLPTHPSIHPSIYLPTHPPIYLLISLATYPPVPTYSHDHFAQHQQAYTWDTKLLASWTQDFPKQTRYVKK